MTVENKNIISVGQLLAEPNLVIPQYQRPYKWTSRHVGQLFSDIAAYRYKTSCTVMVFA